MSGTIDFIEFMNANDNAFRYMGEIREKAISKDKVELVNITNEAFKQVGIMAKEYLKIQPEEEDLLRESFSRAYDNAANTVLFAGKIIGMMNEDIPQYKALFQEDNANGLYRKIEHLPEEFDAGKEDYDLRHVNTLHGLIRYLHQKGITGTFEARSLVNKSESKKYMIEYRLHYGDFKIIDLDNQITAEGKKRVSEGDSLRREDILNKPLQAILDFYEQDITTQSTDYYNLFLKKNAINLHVTLYQHSAEIDAVFNGDKSSIKFRYNEYLNDAWRDRITYIKSGLEIFGFKIAEAKRNLVTDWDHKNEMIRADKTTDEESLKGILPELARLLTSTTHINCVFKQLNGLVTPEMALKMFLNGDTNLRSKFDEVGHSSSYEYFPNPPWHRNEFTKDYHGKTYEEKVTSAMEKYGPELKKFWDKVAKGELKVDKYYMKLKNIPLEELAAKRMEQCNIKTDIVQTDVEKKE